MNERGLMAKTSERSPEFRVRVFGLLACFTRPEMKAERVSYEVMTPGAARGILEAILWKPAIRWETRAIEIHAPIVFTSFRRNEVSKKVPRITAAHISGKAAHPPFFANDGTNRVQRNTLALQDVDYVIRASFVMTERAGPQDNLTKFVEMFERRLQKGQCHAMPYLGCREFTANFEPADEQRKPQADLTKPLGFMFYDFDYGPPIRPRFFKADIVDGVVPVPQFESTMPASDLLPGGRE